MFGRTEQNPSLHHRCSDSRRSCVELHPLARNSPKDWKWALVASPRPELMQRCRGLSGTRSFRDMHRLTEHTLVENHQDSKDGGSRRRGLAVGGGAGAAGAAGGAGGGGNDCCNGTDTAVLSPQLQALQLVCSHLSTRTRRKQRGHKYRRPGNGNVKANIKDANESKPSTQNLWNRICKTTHTIPTS